MLMDGWPISSSPTRCALRLEVIGRWPDTLRNFMVDGTTHDPSDGKIHDWQSLSMDENLQMITNIAALCNEASIAHSEHQHTGMPTEAALKLSTNGCLPHSLPRWTKEEKELANAAGNLASLGRKLKSTDLDNVVLEPGLLLESRERALDFGTTDTDHLQKRNTNADFAVYNDELYNPDHPQKKTPVLILQSSPTSYTIFI